MKLLLLSAALMAGCAPGEVRTGGQGQLAQELAGRVAGQPRNCIHGSSARPLQIIDDGTLLVREGRRLWINRLAGSCSGLRPLSTLIVELHGAQHCRGDRVRALEPGSIIPGPPCLLAEFVPYDMRGQIEE